MVGQFPDSPADWLAAIRSGVWPNPKPAIPTNNSYPGAEQEHTTASSSSHFPSPGAEQEHTTASTHPGAEQEHTTAANQESPPSQTKSGSSPPPKNNPAGDSRQAPYDKQGGAIPPTKNKAPGDSRAPHATPTPSGGDLSWILPGVPVPAWVRPPTLQGWLDGTKYDPARLAFRFDWKASGVKFEVARDFIVIPPRSTLDWNTYGEITLWGGPRSNTFTPINSEGDRVGPPTVSPPAFSAAPDPEDDEYTIYTWVGPATLSIQPPLFAFESTVELPNRFQIAQYL